ncbi:unnamed protein product [Allacma fusca]|uniref:Uncharacterized protein n=1 Tax=Allacma fusca TaxID=39272 RepID=A0A8J2L1F1_9HEXA|nr:unnamed protein product [Allacma fusca]
MWPTVKENLQKMKPTDKTSFTGLSNHVLYLVAQEKYKEALPVCDKILEFPQFSLRARLLRARCLLKLNKNTEYADCIREAKATFPGCFDHIQEFERSVHSPQESQNKINFGALFKTFKGWEEIDRQLNDSWKSAGSTYIHVVLSLIQTHNIFGQFEPS